MRVFAYALMLAGFLLIASYAWSAIIVPWGEPDQSRLFWYVFLLLVGFLFLRAGIRMRNRGSKRSARRTTRVNPDD